MHLKLIPDQGIPRNDGLLWWMCLCQGSGWAEVCPAHEEKFPKQAWCETSHWNLLKWRFLRSHCCLLWYFGIWRRLCVWNWNISVPKTCTTWSWAKEWRNFSGDCFHCGTLMCNLQSSFHLIPLMSSDPSSFIFVSVLQRIKTKSHSGDVPGGPFWGVSLVLENIRALPAPDPSLAAFFPYPKGHNLESDQLAEDCCWIVFEPAKTNKFLPVLDSGFAVSRKDWKLWVAVAAHQKLELQSFHFAKMWDLGLLAWH